MPRDKRQVVYIEVRTCDMVLPGDIELEQPYLAQYDVPDPEAHTGHVVVGDNVEPELARVDRRSCTEEQKVADKLAELMDGRQLRLVAAGDAQACGGLPEIAPASGEHAGPHGLLRREEGEYVLQEIVLKGADDVSATGQSGSLALLRRRHSVEQVALVDAAARLHEPDHAESDSVGPKSRHRRRNRHRTSPPAPSPPDPGLSRPGECARLFFS